LDESEYAAPLTSTQLRPQTCEIARGALIKTRDCWPQNVSARHKTTRQSRL
jgi:hypothetical protein